MTGDRAQSFWEAITACLQPYDCKHADWKLSLGLPNNYRPFVFFKVPVTVRVIGGDPPTPVTVKMKVPLGVDESTVKVSVVDVVAGFGLKVSVVPDGKPVTENVTVRVEAIYRVDRDSVSGRATITAKGDRGRTNRE